MPACHFNIEESDYLSSKRRDVSRPGPVGYGPCMPLDTETKVLEMKAIGVGLPVIMWAAETYYLLIVTTMFVYYY